MNFLVAPLDWGLGHAARMVPVVNFLLSRGHDVIVAASGNGLRLMKAELQKENVTFIDFEGFSARLESKRVVLDVVRRLPYFLWCIYKEHRRLQRIVEQYGIDFVVSDNRYGLYTDKCRTAFVTHQLAPIPYTGAAEWVRRVLSFLLCRWVDRFDYVLVPDVKPAPDGLAGTLSRDYGFIKEGKIKYIGVLSRFSSLKLEETGGGSLEALGIVTGPEPERSRYEAELREKFRSIDGETMIVSSATSCELASLVKRARTVYSHSGYSTIMDLYVLGALEKSFLSPTVGQAEQEYLACRLRENCLIIKN